MARSCTIYGLASTEDGKIRYIGQTIGSLKRRHRQHLAQAAVGGKTRVSKWIRSISRRGHDLAIFPIETNAVLHLAERRLIAWYRRHGANLTNLTDGGEGTIGWHGNRGVKRPDVAERNREARGKPGHPVSAKARLMISMALRGRKRPDVSARNRANKGKPGRPHTAESRAKIGLAHKGKIVSAETRTKISRARRASKAERHDAT